MSTNTNAGDQAEPPQNPSRISWNRHLKLEEKTVEDLRKANQEMDCDADHYLRLVCSLANDLQDNSIVSEALDDVLEMGLLGSNNTDPIKVDNKSSGDCTDEAEEKMPSRISWKRHVELEAQTVEQLRIANNKLNDDVDHFVHLVCRLATDVRSNNIASEALDEVLMIGWLEFFDSDLFVNHYTMEEVFNLDAGIVTLGVDTLRNLLANTLVRIPAEVVDRVFEKCIFLMPERMEQGCFIPNRVITGRDIIMFPEDILERSEKEQIQTILHEIAHFSLGHRSPLEDPDLDYDAQEDEANLLVAQWMEGS